VASLAGFSRDDLARCGDAIRGFAKTATSMEDAARSTVDFLWDELRDGDDAGCVLLRLYKTHPYGDLPSDLQAFARGVLGSEPDAATRCLVLLATRGREPAWNDRRQSEGHQAIPLPSVEFVRRLPMVAALIEQLGLDLADVVEPKADRAVDLAQRAYDVFHVEQARGNAFVPAQEFVERYGVAAALGFGGVLFTGDFFSVVLFSRVPIDEPVADRLRVLSLATRVALLPFSRRVFAS
jgi:hypothetical protein